MSDYSSDIRQHSARPPLTTLVVHFTRRVDGPQPVTGARYENDWHTFAAGGLVRSGGETLFVDGDEIVESWSSDLITRIEWFPTASRGTSLAEKRRQHPRAYERWTDEEDDQLRREHAEGLTAAEMVESHGRNKGAITARLERLGLDVEVSAPAPASALA